MQRSKFRTNNILYSYYNSYNKIHVYLKEILDNLLAFYYLSIRNNQK